ncbi:MAG: LytTR family DNA-binding domain-containing protein, partial [Myxococcota bacterium]
VVLLDIEMTEVSGVEAMGLLPQDGPLVIFVTAHADHAVFAFDAGAVDYVLKPVEPRRLSLALERAQTRLQARHAYAPAAPNDPPDMMRLAIPTRKGLAIIDPDRVRYAIVDGASVVVHTDDGAYVTDFRMVALERKLPRASFVRAHRRVLLNIAHIVALEPVGAGVYVAELTDGATVPVSRQAAKQLKTRWQI